MQKHIYNEKKNPCFYSNIEEICWNFLEHDLKVTNKPEEAPGMMGESLRQAQNRQVGANYQTQMSNRRGKKLQYVHFLI